MCKLINSPRVNKNQGSNPATLSAFLHEAVPETVLMPMPEAAFARQASDNLGPGSSGFEAVAKLARASKR